MNTIPIYQIDAFTDRLFGGNPAAVCPLDAWLEDELLLSVAKENNLAETAFFVPVGKEFHLRWFTPEIEMDLCGHATLATAHVLFRHFNYPGNEIVFSSHSGRLVIRRNGDLLEMVFPSRPPAPAKLPSVIEEGIGKKPEAVLKARDYLLVYASEQDILDMQPNRALLDTINLDPGGIIVTAPGKEADFVSRFFTPQASIFEDPVTGSAHCSLIPYWAERLGKVQLKAHQLSTRKGVLFCELLDEQVLISGKAITYLEGKIIIKN